MGVVSSKREMVVHSAAVVGLSLGSLIQQDLASSQIVSES
jgi:hypothetical protein